MKKIPSFIISLLLIGIIEIFIFQYPSSVISDKMYSVNNTLLYVDEFGYLHLLGDIINKSQKTIANITLYSQFYDQNGVNLGFYYREPEIHTLNSLDISPFEVIYLDLASVDRVKNFTISAEYEFEKEKPSVLYIDNVKSRLDLTGFYYINGQITNYGASKANNVTVIGTIYDKDGKVIGITEAITEPFIIPSKNTASFGLVVTSKSQTFNIKNFSISAYSIEYLSNRLNSNN